MLDKTVTLTTVTISFLLSGQWSLRNRGQLLELGHLLIEWHSNGVLIIRRVLNQITVVLCPRVSSVCLYMEIKSMIILTIIIIILLGSRASKESYS